MELLFWAYEAVSAAACFWMIQKGWSDYKRLTEEMKAVLENPLD